MNKKLHNGFFSIFLATVLSAAMASSCAEVVLPSGIYDLRESKAGYCQMDVQGSVTDTQGKPVGDISIVLIGRYIDDQFISYSNNFFTIDTLKTNAKGIYAYYNSSVSPPFPHIQVNVFDANGVYLPDSIIIRNINYTGGDNSLSYAGRTTIYVPAFTLKKVEE